MNRWTLFIVLILGSLSVKAHQTDLSSTMLIEQADNKWSLILRASLSAFEQEIKTHFAARAYQSPEEFQALIIEHLQSNLGIIINQGSSLALQNAFVKLGHETNVVFEVVGVPSKIASLSIQNTSFQDIHHSQSALIVIKKGFDQKQFLLNADNQYTADLVVEDAQFVLGGQTQQESWTLAFKGLMGLLIIGLGLLGFKMYQNHQRQRSRSPKESPLPYSHTIVRKLN